MTSNRPQFSSDTTQELLDLLKQKARQFKMTMGALLNVMVQHALQLSDAELLRIIHPELARDDAPSSPTADTTAIQSGEKLTRAVSRTPQKRA